MLRINTCRARLGGTFPAVRRHRLADLCESAVSLVYIKNSRLDKATQYDCLKNENECSALERESKLLPSKGLHFIPPTPFQLTSNHLPTGFCLGHCFFLGTGGRRYARSRNSGLLCQRATGWDQEINRAVDSREVTDPFVTQLTSSATSVKTDGEVETPMFIGYSSSRLMVRQRPQCSSGILPTPPPSLSFFWQGFTTQPWLAQTRLYLKSEIHLSLLLESGD